MEPPNPAPADSQGELARRHKTAAMTVRALLIVTVILCLIAFGGRSRFRQQDYPFFNVAVKITILIFGLGSVALRRTKFSAMRLQDITALEGVSGLLKTLERTTLQVALLGIVIVIVGFIGTVMTGNDFYAYGAGLVGFVVLLYCYPTKSSWQRAVEKFAPLSSKPPGPPTFSTTE